MSEDLEQPKNEGEDFVAKETGGQQLEEEAKDWNQSWKYSFFFGNGHGTYKGGGYRSFEKRIYVDQEGKAFQLNRDYDAAGEYRGGVQAYELGRENAIERLSEAESIINKEMREKEVILKRIQADKERFESSKQE